MKYNYLNEEKYNKLKEYNKILESANERKHIVEYDKNKAIKYIKPIYEEIAGTKVKQPCGGCGTGLDWLNRIAAWYVDYKNSFKNKQ